MGRNVFKPLANFEQLEEGELLADANKQLKALAKQMARFRKQHGPKSKKAKGELTIKVVICCDDPEDGQEIYSITSNISTKLPTRPASVSRVLEAMDETEGLTLFARFSGTDDSNPRQGKLTTRDGREIDLETGEANGRHEDVHSVDDEDDGRIERRGKK